MTNKEAKEKLYMEWQKFLEDNIDYAGISEAYKIAFKALEQEPCEDAIRKYQKIVKIIRNYDVTWEFHHVKHTIDEIREVIEDGNDI